ncbi:MAG: hypothetical protein KA066_01930 [Candidatus Pacebacteria bacterium]|nr:hypothetical protein [Candidatus Paceibacterota bacterium]
MKKTLAALTALGMLATATPAFAAVNSSTLIIGNANVGSIDSNTTAVSNTGLNLAGGSEGGDGAIGGNSGGATNSGSNGDATSGNAGSGGNGGNGGAGGLVQTGNASADAGVVNSANSNNTRVRVPGGINSSTAVVAQVNAGDIDEDTTALASTGLNLADGSEGGNGNNGGTSGAANKAGGSDNGNATSGSGGAGGHGGAGGLGGTIGTGASTSKSGAVNVLNTNFLRVRI